MAASDRDQRNPTVEEQLINQARLKLYALAQEGVIPPATVSEFNEIRFNRKYAPVKVNDILAAIITENTASIIFLIHERFEGPPSRAFMLGKRGGRSQNPVVR